MFKFGFFFDFKSTVLSIVYCLNRYIPSILQHFDEFKHIILSISLRILITTFRDVRNMFQK